MLINNRLEEPYDKMPKEGPLPILSKSIIKSKLTKNFWTITQYIYNSNLSSKKKISIEKKVEKPNIKIIKNKNNNYNNSITPIKNNINNNLKININNNAIKNSKLKTKRVTTPKIKNNNFINKEFYLNNQKNENNINNEYKNDLEMLRETAIKLEEELNNNETIIKQQKEENRLLEEKISKLTLMLKSIIPMDKI